MTLELRPSWRSSGSPKPIAQPPEFLPRYPSRDDNPLVTIDVDQLSAKEIDRLYASLERKGELQLTRREQLRFRRMREILLCCLVPYACLLVAYVLSWLARWTGALQ